MRKSLWLLPLLIAVWLVPLSSAVPMASSAIDSHNGIGLPTWRWLTQMSFDRRANSVIDLSLGSEANQEALMTANQIEMQWNSGQFDNAISALTELSSRIGNTIGIGISWRMPIKTPPQPQSALWGDDIPICYHDSVYAAKLVADGGSDALMAIMLVQEGEYNLISVNHSAQSGDLWQETYYWISPDPIPTISTAIVMGHCYIVYPYQNTARLKRFDILTGQAEMFADSSLSVTIFTPTAPDSIKEIALVSNQDASNDRLYCLAITRQGGLRYLWSDQEGLSWTDVNTGIANADRGLDVSFNNGFSNYHLIISYIDRSHNVNIFGRRNITLSGGETGGLRR